MIGAISVAIALLSTCLSAGSEDRPNSERSAPALERVCHPRPVFIQCRLCVFGTTFQTSYVVCGLAPHAVSPGLARLSHHPKNAAGDLVPQQRLRIVFLLVT